VKALAVYCGSSSGARPAYARAAKALGATMAARRIELVYGGGNVGLMGVVADAVLEGGGQVYGVIPRMLLDRELAHAGCTELRVVETMHERKILMANRADAFLALPGGFGTFDELCEVVTWNQLAIHDKPVGLLDVEGYWRALLSFVDQGVVEGFVPRSTRERLWRDDDHERLLDRLLSTSAG
jgi:uncharacterized protein (TIGR00730 family)